MKTVSTLKQTGIFWRPESPRQKLPGILSVSESGKPVLELIGFYGGNTEESMFGSNELGRIVGEVEDGDPITLEGCRYSKRSQSLSGLSKSIVIANYLLKGVLFEDGEPIRFSRTDFFVQGLDEWLGISGFRYENRTDPQELTIHFALPTEILYELPGDISLGFIFGYAFKPGLSKGVINQKTLISIRCKDLKPVDELMKLAFKITRFLSFAMGCIVMPEQLQCRSREITEDHPEAGKVEARILLYYEQLAVDESNKDLRSVLFYFSVVRKKFQEIISRSLLPVRCPRSRHSGTRVC